MYFLGFVSDVGLLFSASRLVSSHPPASLSYRQGFLSGYPNLPHNELHQDWQSRFKFGLQFFFKVNYLQRCLVGTGLGCE